MSVALAAGPAVVATGIALSASRRAWLAPAVQIAGAAIAACVAVVVMASGATLGAPFGGDLHPSFGLDGLSAFFVVVVAGSAIPALLCAHDSLRDAPARRPLLALSGAFVLALLAVLAARDPVTLLASWELMTVIPATAMLVASRDAAVRRAVFVYVAVTHIGGAGVWIAVLVLAREGAIGAQLGAGGPQALVLVSALVGFGTKAGLMPLHGWLPRAHPVAPSHLSAVMSAVMLKVAIYGLLRVVFEWAAPAPRWFGLTLLAAGALSAVGGVLYALVSHELKRLLAFSSIENVGIIALALGAAVLLRDEQPAWSALAFGAALLHVANHAAFKSLLFLGAGAFARETGSLALDRLGGLLRRMPLVGWPFALGCLAIAGLPPLNGFASEWLTLQSLLRLSFSDAPLLSIPGALAVAALAATAALAAFTFVKVIGLVLLGAPRTPRAATAADAPLATQAALMLCAGACVALAACAGLLLPALAGLGPGSAGRLQPGVAVAVPGTGALPALALPLALVGLTVLVRRLLAGAPRAAASPAWACGQVVERRLDWTSAGFTKPLRLTLEAILRPQRDVVMEERAGTVVAIDHRAEVPHLFDSLVYGPTQRVALRGAGVARRLQSGSLRSYILYLLGVLFALLALVRAGGLG